MASCPIGRTLWESSFFKKKQSERSSGSLQGHSDNGEDCVFLRCGVLESKIEGKLQVYPQLTCNKGAVTEGYFFEYLRSRVSYRNVAAKFRPSIPPEFTSHQHIPDLMRR